MVADQEELADVPALASADRLHFIAVEGAVVAHLDDQRVDVGAVALQPFDEVDEFVRLAADLGVHREARAERWSPAFPWRRSSPSRRAPSPAAPASSVSARGSTVTSPRPRSRRRRRRSRGGRHRPTIPLQPTSDDHRRHADEERRPAEALQPARRPASGTGPAPEGHLDEAVGELGEAEDREQLQRDQDPAREKRRRSPAGSAPAPASARGRSCSCAGRARSPARCASGRRAAPPGGRGRRSAGPWPAPARRSRRGRGQVVVVDVDEAEHEVAEGEDADRVEDRPGPAAGGAAAQVPGAPGERQRDAGEQADGVGVGAVVDAGGVVRG